MLPSGCDVILVFKKEKASFAFLHRKEVKSFPTFVTGRANLTTFHRKTVMPLEHHRDGTVEVAVFARVEKGGYNWIRIQVAPVSHFMLFPCIGTYMNKAKRHRQQIEVAFMLARQADRFSPDLALYKGLVDKYPEAIYQK